MIKRICKTCKKEFYVWGAWLRKDSTAGQYCSRHCMKWKGGGTSHYSRIANSVYREHNINVVCEGCGFTNNIHIHHKNHNIRRNTIDNLKALCGGCHSKVHNKQEKMIAALRKKRNKEV